MNLCTVCCSEEIVRVQGYSQLQRVTSDCKPFPNGGELTECLQCGALFKHATNKFVSEITQIYNAYDVYYQGGGVEQLVNDSSAGRQIRRSDLLCRHLSQMGSLSADAKAVDLGCGNGSFLRALSRAFPGWSLYGLELDDRHLDSMRDIPRFAGLIEGEAESLEGKFDFISMIHALEHFTDPVTALKRVRENLTESGVIFIEIPNAEANPFDLLIADHVSHFTPTTLRFALERAGYEIISFKTDWVSKELSVLARKASTEVRSEFLSQADGNNGSGGVRWLEETLKQAREISETRSNFGIFGTSIAATWLAAELGEDVNFYVDEDPSRQNHIFFGKPVLSPTDVPADSSVFIATAPIIATIIASRLGTKEGADYFTPPLI